MEKKTHRHLPLPGQRILRSVIAVWLCFAIYLLRGHQGIPFYSAIAALQCMTPYTRGMRPVARRRLLGTLMGAFFGLILLLLERNVIGHASQDDWVHILLIGVFAGITLYSTVLLKLSDMAYFSTVVLLSITVNHIGDANPYLFVLHRVLDTFIGVAVAELVNRLQLPRARKTDTLFVSGIDDTLMGADKKLSPYSVIELNRILQDGARFTISTMQTPATVRELLKGVELRWPIIAMDGAILYDMDKLRYIRTVRMSEAQAERMTAFLEREGLSFFTNTIEGDLLVIRIGDLGNEAIRQLYEKRRLSPYRNFARRRPGDFANVVYFLIMDKEDVLARTEEKLSRQDWIGDFRVAWDRSKDHDGYSCLKICSAQASRANMLRELEAIMGTKETVTFGSIPGQYDVLIEQADRDVLVKELRRRFEPVDWRCWKNCFRL